MNTKIDVNDNTERSEMTFAVALANGSSVRSAAKRANMPLSTAYRLAKQSSVQQTVAEIRATVVQTACSKAIRLASKAVDTLRELLDDKASSIRLGAARAVIDSVVRLQETAEIEQDLLEGFLIMAYFTR